MGWIKNQMKNAAAKGADVVKEQAKNQVSKVRSSGSGVRVMTNGFPDRDVVGESNYYAAIAKVVGKKGGEVIVDGVLSRDAGNKYDSNAVKLTVGGQTVGFVPREDTHQFHALLDTAARAGQFIIVPTRVYWSPERNIGSVTFDMAPPALAWPVNALPPEYPLWPVASSNRQKKVSVSDDGHAAAMAFLGRAYEPGKCAGFVRLASESDSTRVAVFFEEQRVGELSAQSSKDMLEVLRQAQANRRWVYALAQVSGNRMSSEMSISTKTVAELTDQEVSAIIGTAPAPATDWSPPSPT